MGSYVPNTMDQRKAMLDVIGVDSVDALFESVPQQMLVGDDLKLPEGLSELEVRSKVTAMAEQNRIYKTILRGAGAYRHFIPAVVKSVISREELVTAYTPYQAEISQGILQSIFEYQTMICMLTGMDVSNASVYDGGTAAAEAITMCKDRKRHKAFVSACANPDVIETMKTYCFGSDTELVVVPEKVKVWIKDGLSGEKIGPFEVLPGQVVRLAKQVRTGYDFAGWKASAGALTEESGQWVSSGITKEVTFTATYTEKKPLILSYEGCTGPKTALPGQTITVYAKSPTGAPMTTLEIAPDGSGTCETKGTEGTVTFSATATGDPLIKATYTAVSETLSVTYSGCEGPATVKPGEAVKIPLGPRADGGTLTSVTVAPAYAASVNLATGTVTFTDDFTGLTTATVTATYAVPKAMVSWIGWAGPTTASPGERVFVPLTLEGGRRLVKLTADKGVANTWVGPDDAGVEFAENLSGIEVITITAEYEAPKSGYRLRLR